MNIRKNLVFCVMGLLGLSFVLGQKDKTYAQIPVVVNNNEPRGLDKGADKRAVLGTNYKITGHINPVSGQTFPLSWGRLVNYTTGSDQYGTIKEQRFVFEANNGTIRVVKTDLNWGSDLIDDIEVITIGRNSLTKY